MRSTTVIQRVRQILSEGASASFQDGASVAAAYADLCKQANERLRSCVDSLKRGMVSEALRVAETEPLLLDLCGELDFVGVENWTHLCGQRNWAKPESVDGKAVQLLNEAYASGQALEPLLKEYRRAVQGRKTRECVRLLRHIAEIDKASAHWKSDLKGFEERRLQEIKTEYVVARDASDAETLAALVVEMNDVWVASRDETLKNAVRDAARAIYEKQALAQGRVRLQEVAKAYAAMDYEGVATAIGRYDALVREGYLKPDKAMAIQYDEAREWLEQETKRRQDEQLYDETLAKLRMAVEKGAAESLDEVLNTLARFDRPIPDKLEERARALIDAHQLAVERIRRRRMATAAVAVLLVAAGIAVVITRQRYDAARQHVVEALQDAYQREDLQAINELHARTQQDNARILRDPAVQALLGKKPELDAKLERKRVACEQALGRLDVVRTEGFQASAEVIGALVQEARANARSGGEQARLAAFLNEWTAHNDGVQAEREKKAANDVDAYSEAVDTLLAGIGKEGKVNRQEMISLRSKGGKMETAIGQVSQAQSARLSAAIGKLDVRIGEIDGKDRQLVAIREAGSMREYVDAVKTYCRAFPSDDLSKLLAPLRDLETRYLQLLEGPYGCAADNPFWFSVWRQQADAKTRMEEKWPTIKARLMDLAGEKRYTDLWECDTREGKIYIEGQPTPSYARGYKSYEGMMYLPKLADTQPEFVWTNVVVVRASLMPHCDVVKGLASMARFSSPGSADADIVSEMQKLAANTNISPLLKLRLMEMLADCMVELTAETGAGWRAFGNDLKSIDAELHWLCVLHRDVALGNVKAYEILRRYFPSAAFIREARFLWDVRAISLNRDVKWVGYADLSTKAPLLKTTNNAPNELWIVRLSSDGVPVIKMAAEHLEKGMTQYIALTPGEPLFAPATGKTTREILAALKKKHAVNETKALRWPNSWPANFRE